MKGKAKNLSAENIARAALEELNRVGLDGLTVRAVAQALDVQAPALYWHFKGKQELLDAMAAIIFVEAVSDLEGPRRATEWHEWAADCARRLRQVPCWMKGTFSNKRRSAPRGSSSRRLSTLKTIVARRGSV